MIETGEDLPSDQSEKKQAPGDELMTGKMTGLKNEIYLVVFLPQLFQEIGRERGNEKVRKRRHPGELRKTGNPFVVLRMKLMKMDGQQYDAKAQDDGVKLVSYHIGLITVKDYYTCASPGLY